MSKSKIGTLFFIQFCIFGRYTQLEIFHLNLMCFFFFELIVNKCFRYSSRFPLPVMVFKLILTAVKLVHDIGLVDWLQSYHAEPNYIAYPIILQIIAPGSIGEETLVVEDKILKNYTFCNCNDYLICRTMVICVCCCEIQDGHQCSMILCYYID